MKHIPIRAKASSTRVKNSSSAGPVANKKCVMKLYLVHLLNIHKLKIQLRYTSKRAASEVILLLLKSGQYCLLQIPSIDYWVRFTFHYFGCKI